MSLARTYIESVVAQLRAIADEEMEEVARAATLLCQSLTSERWVYAFGTGHSHMLAEELFYRAGGLARVRPMLFPPLMLHESAERSTDHERDIALVDQLLGRYPIGGGDTLIVASNSGRNPVPVELARRAQVRGAEVIALVNRAHCAAFPSRHPDGLRLTEVASVSLDNHGVVGDACVPLPWDPRAMVGAASTVTGAAVLQMVACATVEKVRAAGFEPELFVSANADDGGGSNAALLAELRGKIEHL